MTPDERRCVVMSAEGNVLSNVQRVGVEYVASWTRAMIDGQVNALMRMEGAEAAARYIFAVGDRVAGGLREPTDFRALELKVPEPAPPPVIELPRVTIIEPAPRASSISSWAWGVLHGAVLALWWLSVTGRLS